jgi:hypothetical protein
VIIRRSCALFIPGLTRSPQRYERVLLAFAVLAGVWVRPAGGCDLCSIYVATEAQGGSGHGFFGGLAEQFTYFNTFQVDGHDVSNQGNQYLNSSISQVYLGYNFNDRLGVQFNVPLIYRSYGYQSTSGNESGLGDVSLLGNVRIFEFGEKKFTFVWSGSAGIKFPTGSTSKLNPTDEDFAPGIGGHDLTLGSGSYDGLLGTGFFARWQRLFLTGAMQYTVRSEGDFGYQFANDWTWIGGPGVYLLLGENHTLSLQAMVSGETKTQDTVEGAELDDTAITSVFLGPQLNFTWSNQLSAQLGGDLPVSIVSTGEQVVPDYRIRAAVTWRF